MPRTKPAPPPAAVLRAALEARPTTRQACQAQTNAIFICWPTRHRADKAQVDMAYRLCALDELMPPTGTPSAAVLAERDKCLRFLYSLCAKGKMKRGRYAKKGTHE